MGGSSSKTPTNQNQPWAGQQNYLSDVYRRASEWSTDPARQQPTYPPFSTVAPLSSAGQAGQQSLLDFAGGGIPQNVTNQLLQAGQSGLNQQQGREYQMMAGGVPYAQQTLRGLVGGMGPLNYQAPNAQFGNVATPSLNDIMANIQQQSIPSYQDIMSNVTQTNVPSYQDIVSNVQSPNVNTPSYQDIMSAAQGGQVPGTQQTIQNMMSGTPDMSVWGPLMAEAQRLPVQAFQEEVLPRLRQEAQGAGQLGGSRAAMATGLAAGRLGESLAGQQTQIAAEAARQAQAQQQAGLQGAIQQGQLGLGMGQLGIGAGQLGLDRGQLELASQMGRGQLGLGAGQLGLGRGQFGLEAQLGAGQLGLSKGQLGLEGQLGFGGQQLQLGGLEAQRANILGGQSLQAQQLQEQSRQANLQAQLGAAQELGGQFQNIYNTAQQSGLGYAGLLPQALQTGALPGTIMGQVGAQQRDITQQQIADEAQRYLASIQGNLPALQEYAALIGGAVPTSSQYAFRGSPLIGALGGGLSGASTGAAIGSVVPGLGTGVGALVGGGIGALGGYYGS